MSARERAAVGLVVSAVGLGILGDLLFNGRPLGVNAVLFAVAFVVALAVILRVGRIPLHQGRRLMAAPLLLFAALLAWHASPLLLAVNLLAIAGAVTLGALRRTRRPVVQAEVSDYMAGAASAGAATFVGAVKLIEQDVPWRAVRERVGRRESAAAIGRGLVLGLPLLAIFGGLFVAADAVFRSLLFDTVPDPGALWSHFALACVIGWAGAGLLRDLLATREEERVLGGTIDAIGRRRVPIGPTEVAVALAVVDLLFLAFVVVQVRYLFGGRDLVESRLHLTYAEYARHGFFELVAAALLVLPLLLGVHALVRGRPERRRLLAVLSAGLIVLVLVVMASALQRMLLYQREYGLTELRIYTTGVILWLGVVFVWLGLTVLRGRPRAFAAGAVVAGFAATLALNVINPDALIARTNLSRPHVDAAYLGSLSDDAVPPLLERLPSLDPPLRSSLAAALLERHEHDGGLLAWNASRSRAESLLAEHRAELQAYALEAQP
jgi:hypothetical protein